MKRFGVLLPIFSLPSKHGIGCFSKEAYEFIDFLKETGHTIWQILPLNPPDAVNSPYSPISVFAGNPNFISLEDLIEEGLLYHCECDTLYWGHSKQYINYDIVNMYKSKLLEIAYYRFDKFDDKFIEFCDSNKEWLDDYADFMAMKNNKTSKNLYKFMQYKFFEQWSKLKQYANDKGIKIMGDMPIYVAPNGVEAWSNPELFQLADNKAKCVAGCPPDDFSKDGQIWGNPLYDWSYHKNTGYQWWIKRMKQMAKMYDIIRIDHFRGFADYYAIPKGKSALEGYWRLGPGKELFDVIEREVDIEIVVEDLGELTPIVHKLMKETGYPGMRVLQFAYNDDYNNPHKPHNIPCNMVIYTGTHDNDTTLGWYLNSNDYHRNIALKELEWTNEYEINWKFIKCAMKSNANTVIIQMQDYLGLDGSCRTNTPGTISINWKWRMLKDYRNEFLINKIKSLMNQ